MDVPDGEKFMPVADHDRIVAERDELWKRATKFVMPGEMDTGESIEHYIKTLEQTIAELRAEVKRLRVENGEVKIENDAKTKHINSLYTKNDELTKQRAKYEADCKRIEYFDDLHEKVATQARVIEKLSEKVNACIEGFEGTIGLQFWESPLANELRRIDLELAAIEKEGAKDE